MQKSKFIRDSLVLLVWSAFSIPLLAMTHEFIGKVGVYAVAFMAGVGATCGIVGLFVSSRKGSE
jgi:hypothetical protein